MRTEVFFQLAVGKCEADHMQILQPYLYGDIASNRI
jgi:hypothetical protein